MRFSHTLKPSTMLHEPYTTERKVLAKFIPDDCKRLLDVGCYSGAFGAELKAKRDIEVWGVEPDSEAAAIARQRLNKVLQEPLTQHTVLPDSYFDVITLNDSLEHIADPAAAIRTLIPKLRPRGQSRLICTLPNMRHIECLEHLFLEKDWRYTEQGIRDHTHLRFFTKLSMRRLLEENGLEVLSQQGINEDWWKRGKPLRRILFRLLPSFTDDMRYIQYVNICRVATLNCPTANMR